MWREFSGRRSLFQSHRIILLGETLLHDSVCHERETLFGLPGHASLMEYIVCITEGYVSVICHLTEDVCLGRDNRAQGFGQTSLSVDWETRPRA